MKYTDYLVTAARRFSARELEILTDPEKLKGAVKQQLVYNVADELLNRLPIKEVTRDGDVEFITRAFVISEPEFPEFVANIRDCLIKELFERVKRHDPS